MIIVFEGLDGAGKSFLIDKLKDELSKKGSVMCLKTPDDIFSDLRKSADKTKDVNISFKFYHLCNLFASLQIDLNRNKFDFILLDRYFYSTFVSHKYKGLDIDINYANSFTQPDFLFFITSSNLIRSQRLENRKSQLLDHDLLSLNPSVEHIANELYGKFKFKTIDNSGEVGYSISQILNEIFN